MDCRTTVKLLELTTGGGDSGNCGVLSMPTLKVAGDCGVGDGPADDSMSEGRCESEGDFFKAFKDCHLGCTRGRFPEP